MILSFLGCELSILKNPETGVAVLPGFCRYFHFYLRLKVKMVGLGGLEPPTSRLSGVRSNHLSYSPIDWEVHLYAQAMCAVKASKLKSHL